MTEETHDIEALLRRYRPAGPDAALRTRIVGQSRRRSAWLFVEAVAAMVLIGLNLAQIGATAAHFVPPARVDEARTRAVAAAITRLDLPLSRDQAQVMAMELAAGGRLVPLPLLRGGAIDLNNGAMP